MADSQLQVSTGFVSETGRRERNEDYAAVCLGGALQRLGHGVVAAVADGVSGAKGGRVAAETTVRQFIEGYYGQRETIGVQVAAARALEAVNRWLHALGRRDPALENCATTFTALILRGRRVHVLHVGDSRAYRLCGPRLSRLTEDHTVNRHDLSHVLYRAVGLEEAVRLDHAVQPLQPYDRFLLCSDGVHGSLPDARIREVLLERSGPEAAARALVDAALAAGSLDNLSAVVIDVNTLPPPDHAELAQALADLPVGPPPKPGDCVDGFRLGELMSEGRYSLLFRAGDGADGQPVVLKFPKPEVAAAALYRRAFQRDSWVAARVRNPGIGEVIELPPGRQSRLYSVMPFYQGETLEARLARSPPLGLAEGVGIAIKLARAVTALHRAGIIHRDIKPENVLLLSGEEVRLIDLGAVRLPRLEEEPETEIPGTPSYMAPELFAGAHGGDELSDLYALGVTIYRAFSGAYPYGEVEAFSHPRFGRPVPLSARRRDMPAWLEAVLARAVAVSPRERFGDALEFAAELENGLARGGALAVKPLPLYHRNPLRFWQGVSLALLLALIATLAGGR